MADNDVEIVVKASDRTRRGFSAVRRRARNLVATLAKESDADGNRVGGRLARGMAAGLGRTLTASIKPIAATAAGLFAAQFLAVAGAALSSGVTKLVQGLGAALALLPAAGLAAAAALGSVKIALSGVGDALAAGLAGETEAFNEALEGLSPSARKVTREVVGFRDEIDALKSRVQERFFAPLVGQIAPLVDRYLPQTSGLLSEIAQSFGAAGSQASSFLRMDSTVQKLTEAFGDTSAAVQNLIAPLGRLPEIITPLITVGADFLPQLTDGFGAAADRAASFMAEAERTGELRQFIGNGIDSLRQLVDTGRQVGRIFGNIGAIGEEVWSAMGIETGSVLDTIEQLTERAERFLSSAEGSEVLTGIFGTLGTVLAGLRDTFARVAGIIGDVFGPLMPQIGDLVEAFSRLKTEVIDVGLDALEPILHGIGDVLDTVVLPALTGLANWLADNRPVLQGIGIAIMSLLVPAFLAWAVNAGLAAAATIAAAAPIILLGAAIAGLAALFITHWETIREAVATALGWIRDNWPTILAILTGPIGVAVLLITKNWDRIKDGATAVKDWIVDRFNDLVGFITGLPGRISGAASGMWNGIKDTFRSVLNTIIGWWNGLSFSLPSVPDWVPGIGGRGGGELGTPNIPRLARGGIRSGAAVVGDRGAELVNLGAGGRVRPSANTDQILDRSGGPMQVTVHLEVHGSVLSERDLIGLVRDELNNGGLRGAIRTAIGA